MSIVPKTRADNRQQMEYKYQYLRIFKVIVWILSGEWILELPGKPENGGGVILFRSLCVSTIMYLCALAIKTRLEPYGAWTINLSVLRANISTTLPWFGAIFAGSYAIFYARFASQWAYLADVYNQIKAAELTSAQAESNNERAKQVLAEWKAGFIEDSEELHLATKRIFASVVLSWGSEPLVQAAYIDATIGGKERLEKLLSRVEIAARAFGRQSVP